jgi:hypothetical protein
MSIPADPSQNGEITVVDFTNNGKNQGMPIQTVMKLLKKVIKKKG